MDIQKEQFNINKPVDWISIEGKDGFYIYHTISGANAQVVNNFRTFFIARHPMEVLVVQEIHSVAGTDAGAVTLDIEKLTSTTAEGSGNGILTSEFDLKSTANTVVKKEKEGLNSYRVLAEGDRLAMKLTGTPTSLVNLCITLYCKPIRRGNYR